MTKIENLFEFAGSYPLPDIEQICQDTIYYLEQCGQLYNKIHGPRDYNEQIATVDCVRMDFAQLFRSGCMKFKIVHEKMEMSLSVLEESFGDQVLQGLLVDISILQATMANILHPEFVPLYQRLYSFFDLLSAILQNSIGHGR